MKGFDAVAYGIADCGIKIVTGVPGFPITELMEAIKDPIFKYGDSLRYEWSINEKVALELALGSSVCGERSAVLTKHVGMNILADPLISSATHTIGAGVVIITGDDPGVQKSQNEQDSRFYGLIAEVPVFDPPTPQALYTSIHEGFRLSEEVSTPVIIRVTDRLLNSEGDISQNRSISKSSSIDKKIWLLTMLGKHQRFHQISLPVMEKNVQMSKLNVYKKRGASGIISSGFPSSLVDRIINNDISHDISHLSITTVNPLPLDLVHDFIKEHDRVLVVEETEPVIEKQLSRKVLGKLTGHMPYGMVKKEDIQKAIQYLNKDIVPQVIKLQKIEEPRPLCEDCPYIPLYKTIKELDVPVAGDLGCSILTSSPPMCLLDAAFSLGSSISTASGFNRKGIAIIGDYGLMHSGIPGLINAVYNKHELVVIVLQNNVAAMTGGQQIPDITDMISSCVKDTSIIDPEADIDIKGLLLEKLNIEGISVVLARAKCPRYERGEHEKTKIMKTVSYV